MQLGGTAIFCDNFANKNPGIPSRTGGLDPNVWSVSRQSSDVDFSRGLYNPWAQSNLLTCSGPTPVFAPNNVMVCNNQIHESTNDDAVTVQGMYPKQPFDFAGRTGTVSFEVGDDTNGSHTAWPEFWITSAPVPAPFEHFQSYVSLPQFGFGIRLDGFVDQNGNGASCPEGSSNLGSNNGGGYTGVGSAIVVNNYVANDADNPGATLRIIGYDCVKQPTSFGQVNHFEVKVSQNQIDIYGTDAGVAPTPTTLKHLATIPNANLGFTRGLIWLEEAHYNPDKGSEFAGLPSQRDHTFVWSNVAFDGPFVGRDFSYDALDANIPVNTGAPYPVNNLGQMSPANQTASWNVPNIPSNPNPAAVKVLFNFFHVSVPTSLIVTVNGHQHPTPWPYPDQVGNTWRTLAVTIPVTDLVAGTNVVQIGSDQQIVSSNVNIVLADVPGGVPVLPGSNNAYPAGGASPSQ